jgi:hypothetical protein
MIVPPRLVAGCLAVCAAVLLAAENAPAQRRLYRSAWQGPVSPSPRLNAAQSGRYLPRHLRSTGVVMQESTPGIVEGPITDGPAEIVQEDAVGPHEEILEGGTVLEGAPLHPGAPGDVAFDIVGEDACCGETGCSDGHCGSQHDSGCGCITCCCCCIPLPCLSMPNNFYVSAGAVGFKGPINRGADSSFGFNEAVNGGGPFNLLGAGCGLGAQFGVRGVHTNLSGATGLTDDVRNQFFVTTGLFRRVDCGLQFGAVIDYLHEDWDIELNLAQVRGEISWMFVTQSEFGFRYTGGVADDQSPAPPDLIGIDWRPVDQYSLFARQKMSHCGEGQVWAGVSGEGEGILGASAILPLGDAVALAAEFAYLVPDVGADNVPVPGSIEESWNVGLGVVFYPGAGFLSPSNYYRPLFEVANNGTFFYDVD